MADFPFIQAAAVPTIYLRALADRGISDWMLALTKAAEGAIAAVDTRNSKRSPEIQLIAGIVEATGC